MLTVYKVKKHNIPALKKVSDILYKCGRSMAREYGLHHWDNSYVKNWLIVAMCTVRNDIYLVYNQKIPVATFQIRKSQNTFMFQKLATDPSVSSCGIGSFCLMEIERLAKECGYSEVCCEVYDKSEHAMTFYEHRGYTVYGTAETLKYRELKLRKEI